MWGFRLKALLMSFTTRCTSTATSSGDSAIFGPRLRLPPAAASAVAVGGTVASHRQAGESKAHPGQRPRKAERGEPTTPTRRQAPPPRLVWHSPVETGGAEKLRLRQVRASALTSFRPGLWAFSTSPPHSALSLPFW